MNAIVEWVQRLAGHGSHRRPSAYESDDAAERDLPVPDWTWIAMFPGDMPVGLMEILVRSERGHAEQDYAPPMPRARSAARAVAWPADEDWELSG